MYCTFILCSSRLHFDINIDHCYLSASPTSEHYHLYTLVSPQISQSCLVEILNSYQTSSTRQEFLSFSSKPLTGDLMFNLVKSLHFYYETREGEDKRTKDQQKNFKILRISHWLSCSHVIAQLGSYWLRQA